MIFGEIDSFFSLLDRFKSFFKNKDIEVHSEQSELLSTRLVRAFEAHGIHRNQIPRVIENGLTLYDVQSDENFLIKIDDKIIQESCSLLGIKRDWLEGASEQIYPTYDFYKNPYAFRKFLENRLAETNHRLTGVLLSPQEKDNSNNAVLIIQETVFSLESNSCHRYYICNNWNFSYWKSRVYLTACVSICWKNELYVSGKTVPNKFINSIAWGLNILNFGQDGLYCINGESWHVEDMASSPEVFLKGIDPGYENYGIKSGLDNWLKLYNEGLMDYGVPDYEAKSRFINERKKFA
ncbi:hypothetical protein V5H34_17795 [Vibrio cholerae]|uniref:hypothetical protein n=1 Tax=Vibrio cholerae TaxID=666 RepID=UPI0039675B75